CRGGRAGRADTAERHPGAQGTVPAEGDLGDPNLRRLCNREDPDRRGEDLARAGDERQGAVSSERRDASAPGLGIVTEDLRSRLHHPGETGNEAFVRHSGRGLLIALHSALRALKLYPVENATVQKSLDDLQHAVLAFITAEQEIELRLSGDFMFL